jgi:hypothetical protein
MLAACFASHQKQLLLQAGCNHLLRKLRKINNHPNVVLWLFINNLTLVKMKIDPDTIAVNNASRQVKVPNDGSQ